MIAWWLAWCACIARVLGVDEQPPSVARGLLVGYAAAGVLGLPILLALLGLALWRWVVLGY